MNLEKYTERVRGFIQSAESLARREGHQQFTPEHILKVLLEDDQGLSDRHAVPPEPRSTQLGGEDRHAGGLERAGQLERPVDFASHSP